MTTSTVEHSANPTGAGWSKRKKRLLFTFLLISMLGAWLNAQGGWVKDFSYHRVVVLPFLFQNFTTTGYQWYIAGIFDDLLGLTSNLVGIYGFKKLTQLEPLNKYKPKYFIIPLLVYLVVDFVAFLNFNNYYSGVTDISRYGEIWNILQYFGLIPAFILMDSLLILYDTGGRKNRVTLE